MKFDCEKCGKIDYVLTDGYSFGERMLEGLTFKVTKNDNGTCEIGIVEKDKEYFSRFDSNYWIPLGVKHAEEEDIFECPQCGGDAVPDDKLDNYT